MQIAVKSKIIMEYEKLLPAVVSAIALFFSVFSFWKNRKDTQVKKSLDDAIELEKAHLTDSANFRAELREEMQTLRGEVKSLKSELKETEHKLEATESDLADLQVDFNRVIVEKEMLANENKKLLSRVSELEREVKILKDEKR